MAVGDYDGLGADDDQGLECMLGVNEVSVLWAIGMLLVVTGGWDGRRGSGTPGWLLRS